MIFPLKLFTMDPSFLGVPKKVPSTTDQPSTPWRLSWSFASQPFPPAPSTFALRRQRRQRRPRLEGDVFFLFAEESLP